jgi:hypothetical protein
VACLTGGAAAEQSVSAPELKAAFILNFVKFTEWPAVIDGPVTICVLGDAGIGEALAGLVRGRTLEAHAVVVRNLPSDSAVRGCHVIYVNAQASLRLGPILEQAAAACALTVSDAPRFAEGGGMIGLFVDKGRMKFAVNVDAVSRSKLRVSSRVLSLATIVKDTHAQ